MDEFYIMNKRKCFIGLIMLIKLTFTLNKKAFFFEVNITGILFRFKALG